MIVKAKQPKQSWNDYKSKVYDGELSPDHEKECSNSFYAGMFQAYTDILIITALPDRKAMKELEKYAKSIQIEALSNNPTGEN